MVLSNWFVPTAAIAIAGRAITIQGAIQKSINETNTKINQSVKSDNFCYFKVGRHKYFLK